MIKVVARIFSLSTTCLAFVVKLVEQIFVSSVNFWVLGKLLGARFAEGA